jgi:hypothetical protein
MGEDVSTSGNTHESADVVLLVHHVDLGTPFFTDRSGFVIFLAGLGVTFLILSSRSDTLTRSIGSNEKT